MGAGRWYIIGAYQPPNNVPAVRRMEQSLALKLKMVETILLGDLNARLGEPCDKREEDLVMALADYGLEYITRHFNLRRRYRGQGLWTC